SNICNDFFILNDIHINTDKSYLISINKKQQQFFIQLQNQTIHLLLENQAIRILGVWHNGKGNKKHQENFIHTITDQTSYILKKKTITDKQLRYIINHNVY